MDYTDILDQCTQASLHDVYRLQTALTVMLDDPARLEQVRSRLAPGQDITYFNWQENRLVKARILELKRTRVAVRQLDSGKCCTIPLYWVNLDDAPSAAPARHDGPGIPRSELRVGDQVGFRDRDNITRCGPVVQLNPKTATVLIDGQARWRVSYGLLFDIIDGQRPPRKLVSSVEVFDV